MSSRDAILQRLRKATKDIRAGSPRPDISYSLTGQAEKKNIDPVQLFCSRLQDAGGNVLEVNLERSLASILAALLQETRARSIWWEYPPLLRSFPLSIALSGTQHGKGYWVSDHPTGRVEEPVTIDFRQVSREELELIPLSVSVAHSAIAETGTVVEAVWAGRSRILPVLPPAHIVLLRQTQILHTAYDFLAKAIPREASSYTFVTGPSRTADIEKTLVTGVHGPGQLFVILV